MQAQADFNNYAELTTLPQHLHHVRSSFTNQVMKKAVKKFKSCSSNWHITLLQVILLEVVACFHSSIGVA
jgi:hypothetical protein